MTADELDLIRAEGEGMVSTIEQDPAVGDEIMGERHKPREGRECRCACRMVAGSPGRVVEVSAAADVVVAVFHVPSIIPGQRPRAHKVAYRYREVTYSPRLALGTRVMSNSEPDAPGAVVDYDEDLLLPVIEWRQDSPHAFREACELGEFEVIS
jgi:hypothetical protein